ncbi:hypothetical protein [Limnofasciculus baicalensis]|uniref:hypothetical protein n=1 Tax=Limnofasciculus baicalensis TaxID=3064906 RepID=UPI0020A7E60A|nr:hypothetical protein [Limnofasciculus baicalensis]
MSKNEYLCQSGMLPPPSSVKTCGELIGAAIAGIWLRAKIVVRLNITPAAKAKMLLIDSTFRGLEKIIMDFIII